MYIRSSKPEQKPALNLHIWDNDQALKRLNQNSDLLEKLVEIYRDSTPKLIHSIKESAADKDHIRLKDQAHALKGISANINAEKIASTCQQLESMSTDIDDPKLSKLINQLQEDYDALDKKLTS